MEAAQVFTGGAIYPSREVKRYQIIPPEKKIENRNAMEEVPAAPEPPKEKEINVENMDLKKFMEFMLQKQVEYVRKYKLKPDVVIMDQNTFAWMVKTIAQQTPGILDDGNHMIDLNGLHIVVIPSEEVKNKKFLLLGFKGFVKHVKIVAASIWTPEQN